LKNLKKLLKIRLGFKFLSVVLVVFFCLSSIQLLAGGGDEWVNDIIEDYNALLRFIQEAEGKMKNGCCSDKNIVYDALKILNEQLRFLRDPKNNKQPEIHKVIRACRIVVETCNIDVRYIFPCLSCSCYTDKVPDL
jgi:hypothetical protein